MATKKKAEQNFAVILQTVRINFHRVKRLESEFRALRAYRYTLQLGFRNLFRSLINGESRLVDVKQLRYLKSAVRGSAVAFIEHVPLTTGGFIIAWQLLEERFDNPPVMVLSYVQQNVNSSAVRSSRIPSLRLFPSGAGLKNARDDKLSIRELRCSGLGYSDVEAVYPHPFRMGIAFGGQQGGALVSMLENFLSALSLTVDALTLKTTEPALERCATKTTAYHTRRQARECHQFSCKHCYQGYYGLLHPANMPTYSSSRSSSLASPSSRQEDTAKETPTAVSTTRQGAVPGTQRRVFQQPRG
ncbi:hypothetical protein KM043_017662 [Ampulex compressa]|nr:hypothetical protein KM043_017662 [Ampulex compressa]